MKIGPFNLTWGRKSQAKHIGSGYGYNTYRSGGTGYENTHHPIFKLLSDCTDNTLGQSPRDRLGVYRALFETVPILPQAVDWTRFAIGKMKLVSEDKGLQTILDEFQDGFQIKNENQNEFNFYSGLSNFIVDLSDFSQRDGMAFGELFRDGNRGPVQGVVTRDASLFYPQSQDGGRTVQLIFNSFDGPVTIQDSSDFIGYSARRDPRFFWGVPLGYGTEKAHEDYLRRVLANDGTMMRIGYPPTVHVLSADVENIEMNPTLMGQLTGGVDANGVEQKGMKDQMADAYSSGVKNQTQRGRSFDMWALLAGKTKYDQHVHGAGLPLPNNYPEESEMNMKQIARRGGIPLSFYDFNLGAVGIGSDKFRQDTKKMISVAEHHRPRLDRPTKQITDAFLVSIGAPESSFTNYRTEWETPSLENFKEKAETKKIEAEGTKVELENYLILRDQGATVEASNYAAQIGREDISKIE